MLPAIPLMRGSRSKLIGAVLRAAPFAALAHLVEQRPCKAQVVGSSPTGGSSKKRASVSSQSRGAHRRRSRSEARAGLHSLRSLRRFAGTKLWGVSSSKLPVWAALLGSGIAGMLVAVQSRVNGGLSQQIGNGYVTAVVSFGSGLVVMCIAVLVSRRAKAGLVSLRAEVTAGRLPLWTLLGGAAGAAFVLGQGLVAPITGLALFTVGIVAGQVLGGLILDRAGLGPGGRIDPTPPRLVGTGLAVLAVIISVGLDLAVSHAVWLVVFPVLIGVGVAGQSMVNGLVRAAARSAVTSTFVNFVVGTAVLAVIAVVSVASSGWPTEWPTSPLYYVGGIIGTVFIAVAAMLVRAAGVLLLSMSNVAGQLIASLLLEAGLPLAGGVSAAMAIGTAVALAAVVIASLPGRGSRA